MLRKQTRFRRLRCIFRGHIDFDTCRFARFWTECYNFDWWKIRQHGRSAPAPNVSEGPEIVQRLIQLPSEVYTAVGAGCRFLPSRANCLEASTRIHPARDLPPAAQSALPVARRA